MVERQVSRRPRFKYPPMTSAHPDKLGAIDGLYGQIRPAGANAMRDSSDDWDIVDQCSDESFPASDPPSFNP